MLPDLPIGVQELKLPNGKGFVCEELRGSTIIGATVKPTITFLVGYSECEAFGDKATVTTGDLTFFADGSLSVLLPDEFVITVPVAKCSVRIASGGGNTLLGTIKYTNTNKQIRGSGTVEGIEYEANSSAASSFCGTSKLLTKGATFVGNALTTLVGGEIKAT